MNFSDSSLDSPIKVGTRGSKLAIVQTKLFVDYVHRFYPGILIEVVPIITSGDIILDKPLYEVGGKALFTKEIEIALLNGEIDLAVHSAKDIEANYSSKLCFPCVLPQENDQDVFISRDYKIEPSNIYQLKDRAIIGTSSVRRQAQIRRLLKKEIQFVPIRGNIDTRLSKLKIENFDGIILAYAGIKRLGLFDQNMHILNCTECIPAVGQGIIAIQSRTDNVALNGLLHKISDYEANIKFNIGRAFVEEINGSCVTPLAMDVEIKGRVAQAKFAIFSNRSDFSHIIEISDSIEKAKEIGIKAGAELLKYMDYI